MISEALHSFFVSALVAIQSLLESKKLAQNMYSALSFSDSISDLEDTIRLWITIFQSYKIQDVIIPYRLDFEPTPAHIQDIIEMVRMLDILGFWRAEARYKIKIK
jgi:hypothetical protein